MRHGEGPFCLILETRACPPMLSSVSSRQRTPIGEVRPPPFYSGRYCAHGLAAESRGAQCGMRQKGPASDLEKQQKKDNLTQERRVNAFLLKKVILLKKLIRTNKLKLSLYEIRPQISRTFLCRFLQVHCAPPSRVAPRPAPLTPRASRQNKKTRRFSHF